MSLEPMSLPFPRIDIRFPDFPIFVTDETDGESLDDLVEIALCAAKHFEDCELELTIATINDQSAIAQCGHGFKLAAMEKDNPTAIIESTARVIE